jgi:3-oxoacyl-[acyl-carrier-protein] synthase-3
MNISRHLKIRASGKYLPDKCILSSELEEKLGLPRGWSLKYSGVRERRHVEEESNADLAVGALKQALQRAQLNLGDIDLVINASATFDYILPFQAAFILESFPLKKHQSIAAMDINSSCLSFISALEVANSLLQNEQYQRIAIVSAEVSSKGLNPDDAECMTLFGDGAAAFILEKGSSSDIEVCKSGIKTYPEGFHYSIIKGGGNKYFFKDYTYDPLLHSFSMQGKKLLRLVKRKIPEFFDSFFKDESFGINDVDILIPHQASKAGLTIFQSLYPDFKGLVYSHLETHGNCISASIPMCFHEVLEKGMIQKEQHCLLSGTAAGLAIGGLLLKF